MFIILRGLSCMGKCLQIRFGTHVIYRQMLLVIDMVLHREPFLYKGKTSLAQAQVLECSLWRWSSFMVQDLWNWPTNSLYFSLDVGLFWNLEMVKFFPSLVTFSDTFWAKYTLYIIASRRFLVVLFLISWNPVSK
jgi:hypothetical protein